ncbi:MAG: Ldh family oxidoreductase [Bacillota bacterium]
MEDRSDYLRIPADRVRDTVQRILERLDVPGDDAATVAEVLVTADLRGIESHGVSRLIRYYVEGIREGNINPRSQPRIVRETGAVFSMDGDNGLGHVVCKRAMERAMDLAGEFGVGIGTVGNSNHFGIAGYYSNLAAERGMIGLCLTNSRPLVLPTGSKKAMIGTNPISVAIPAGEQEPFLLDMATSGVPIGKVEVKRRRGKKVPMGWGADSEGRITDDPEKIIDGGGLFPLGGAKETAGYKGYGLGAVVDVLCGVLSGASVLTSVLAGADPGASGVGHFVGAMRIDALMDPDDFASRMDGFIRELRAAPLAAGEEEVLVAGDPEWRHREENLRLGVSLHRDVWSGICEVAEDLGIEGV